MEPPIDSISKARQLRREVIEICSRTGTGHVGSALSMVDLLVTLYEQIIRGKFPDPDRDRVILSKGHASSALYVLLAQKGILPRERYDSFAVNGTRLGHHPHLEPQIGLEANTGSLGHGLSIGCGLAYAALKIKSPARTFVIMSDGETNEGSVWEAAAFAGHHKLSNLCAILDANKIQAMGFTKDIVNPISHGAKWAAFGWTAIEIDGHDHSAIAEAFGKLSCATQPLAIIAHTVKGKGVSFMENNVLWHYRCPKGEEYAAALRELQ